MLRSVLIKRQDNDLVDLLIKILLNPAPTKTYDKALLAKGSPRVWSMQFTYLESLIQLLNHPVMADIKSDMDTWHKRADEESVIPDPPESHWWSIDTVKEERNAYCDSIQYVCVDLLASDEQLHADFAYWLATKRGMGKYKTPKKDITDSDMHEWCFYKPLALIDLDLFSIIAERKISNATVGALLFPNQYDVDLAERVRKVVRPIASKLMSSDFLSAIDEQVARSERK
jgi:hypothetical protein